MQPRATIEIAIMPDGNVTAKWQGTSELEFYGVLEVVKDLYRKRQEEKQRGPGLQIPAADLIPVLNGRRAG